MKKPAFAAISLLLTLTLCGCGATAVPQSTATPTPAPTETATTMPSPTPQKTAITEEMTQVVYDLLELNTRSYKDTELEQVTQSIIKVKGSLSQTEIEQLKEMNDLAKNQILSYKKLDGLIMGFFSIDEKTLHEIKTGFQEYHLAKKKAELNQNIHDFLNYEGKFTEIMTETFTIDCGGNDFEPTKLGIVDEIKFKGSVEAQGMLLGYFETGDFTILIMGFSGRDGRRIVVPMEIASGLLEGDISYHFIEVYRLSQGKNEGYVYASSLLAFKKTYLSKCVGRGVIIELVIDGPAAGNELRESFLFEDVSLDKALAEYMQKVNENVQINKKLLKTIIDDGVNLKLGHVDEIELPNVSKIHNITENFFTEISEKDIPLITGITFYPGK